MLSLLLLFSGTALVGVGAPQEVQATGPVPHTPGGVEGAVLWLNSGAGIHVADGGKVAEWQDQSGEDNHAKQTTAGLQPTYSNNAQNNINFNPVVRFNGSNHLDLDVNKLPTGKADRTIVAVAASDVLSGNHYILSWGTRASSQMMGMLQLDTTGSLTGYTGEFKSAANFWQLNVPNELFGTYDGTEGALYSKMFQIGKANRSWNTGTTSGARIGAIIGANDESWKGTIGDVIVYDKVLNQTERQQLSSYLSIKYGYTLEGFDYLSSNETIVWNITDNAGYNTNIAGIARDDGGSLLQKQSNSTNAGAQVVIHVGQLAATNLANSGELQDGQYFIWGDNGDALDFTQPVTIGATAKNHAERIWKVQNTGNVGQVQVAIPAAAVPANVTLLVSNSDSFAASQEYALTPVTANGTTYYAATVTLTDGQYFTFAEVNKTALQGLVDDVNGALAGVSLEEEDYTPASWAELQKQLASAREILADDQATQAQVDQAFIDLAQALDKLAPAQAPSAAAPQVVTAAVYGSPPNQVVLTFDKGITLTDVDGFSLIGSNGMISVTADVYNDLSADGKTLTLTLNRAVKPGETLTISYDEAVGNVEAANDATPLASFYQLVENGVQEVVTGDPGELAVLELRDSTGNAIATDPAFTSNNGGIYTATVPNSTEEISINPVKSEAGTSLKVYLNGQLVDVSDWSKLPLQVGKNVIEVKTYNDDGDLLETYTMEITREGSGGGSGGGGGGGGSGAPSAESAEDAQSAGIITTDNGQDAPFATGETTDEGTQVTIDSDRLQTIFGDGQAHQLGIEVDAEGEVQIGGLTAEDIRELRETGSTLEIRTPLALYPVPQNQLNLEELARQFGDTALEDIEAQITIRPADDNQVLEAQQTAASGNYDILVNPVQLDLTFSHNGKTVQIDHLNGYATKYIALPAGIDRNRITTGIITYPDGTIFHVPTEVVNRSGQYFAKINDLISHGTYSVIWNPRSFSDVENHWVGAAANNMGARLIIEGTGNNLFEPDREVTRAEFATFIARGLGLMHQNVEQTKFEDVQTGTWYHDPIMIADQFGIVLGYGDGTFRGNQRITREQGIAMIARAYRFIETQPVLSQGKISSILANHVDHADISKWAQEEVALMVSLGIVHGVDEQHLNPQDKMTRAEAAVLIERILKQTGLID